MIWYALCVQPSKELVAERLLVDEGYNIFVPTGPRARRPNFRVKRKVIISGPVLPGYVFVGFDTAMGPDDVARLERPIPWSQIMKFSMISGVLGFAGEPCPIYDPEMREVFMMGKKPIPYVSSKKRKRGKIAAGMGYEAEIVSGPYAGRTVRVIEVSGRIEALYELYKPRLEAA